jgi:hypothetical protein
MVLRILSNQTVSDVQKEFNHAYPFLKIEFYKNIEPGFSRKHLVPQTPIKAAGLTNEGTMEITDFMTVGSLESGFREKFGLNVQVSRKSGTLWLETTISDKWSLKQQNDHGRELSLQVSPVITDGDRFHNTGS